MTPLKKEGRGRVLPDLLHSMTCRIFDEKLLTGYFLCAIPLFCLHPNRPVVSHYLPVLRSSQPTGFISHAKHTEHILQSIASMLSCFICCSILRCGHEEEKHHFSPSSFLFR